MSRCFIGLITVSLLVVTSTAFAESLPEQCANKDKEIAGMEQKLGVIDKEVAELNGKLEALAKQRAELEGAISAKKQALLATQKEIKSEQSKKKRMCAPLAKCKKREAKIDDLKAKIKPVDENMFAIKKEVGANNTAALGIANRVRKILDEFEKKGCEVLKKGKDSQATIDRCKELFGQWQSLLPEIDKSAAKNKELRAGYLKQQKTAKKNGKSLFGLQKMFQKQCSFSSRLAEIDDLVKKQDQHGGIEDTLKTTDDEIAKIKGMTIAEPVVKKPKKEKAAEKEKDDKLKFGFKGKVKAEGEVPGKGKVKAKASVDAKGEVDPKSKKVKGKVKTKSKVKGL